MRISRRAIALITLIAAGLPPASPGQSGEPAPTPAPSAEPELPQPEPQVEEADPGPAGADATPEESGLTSGGDVSAELLNAGLSAEEMALLREVDALVDEATDGDGSGSDEETDVPAPDDPDAASQFAPDEPSEERALEWSGLIGLDAQHFFSGPADPRQMDFGASLVVAPELQYRWDSAGGGRRNTLTLSPFYRLDAQDSERSHFDLRELNLLTAGDGWNLRVGSGKVFWGATEAVHWVDIVNQTDLVEDIDGEDKLGQPMVNLNLNGGRFGDLGLFVLPYFRERTFPGADGRPRTIPRIVGDRPIYESSAEEWHTDFALRWSKSIGSADIGLSYFYGTSREPSYLPMLDRGSGEVLLHPYYELIHQGSLDLQYALDEWLFKLETVYRSGQGGEDFVLVAGGFEYTFYRIFGTAADLGAIGEFLYDSRGNNDLNPYENDIVAGVRLALNDQRDTSVLLTAITDVRDGSTVLNLEAGMRWRDNWRVVVEGRAFAGIPGDDFPLNGLRHDHSLLLGLEYHF